MARHTDSLDRRHFPSSAAYLERVPGGLAAYPDCQVRATVLQAMMNDYPLATIASQLPGPLADLVLHPPLGVRWISQVHYRALLRVVMDHHFQNAAAFATEWYEAQRRLLGGPLYRMMFALLSPERMGENVQSRWSHFHRGLTMEAQVMPKQLNLQLCYPPRMYEHLDHRLTLAGIRGVLEQTGACDLVINILETGETCARSRATWR